MLKRGDLLNNVQKILFHEWDPIGVNSNELLRDEYDSYAPGICQLLQEGVDECKLANHLSKIQRDSMGMTIIDEELNRRIAHKLIRLVR